MNELQTITMIEQLTRTELSKLNKMVLGYGKFRYTAAKAGIPENTLRYILKKGHGLSDNILKIRVNLLGHGTQNAA
jgi:hypothetical protein